MAQNLVLNILAKDKTRTAFRGIQAGLSNLRESIFSVQSALIGIGGGLVVRSFLKVGRDVEELMETKISVVSTGPERKETIDINGTLLNI